MKLSIIILLASLASCAIFDGSAVKSEVAPELKILQSVDQSKIFQSPLDVNLKYKKSKEIFFDQAEEASLAKDSEYLYIDNSKKIWAPYSLFFFKNDKLQNISFSYVGEPTSRSVGAQKVVFPGFALISKSNYFPLRILSANYKPSTMGFSAAKMRIEAEFVSLPPGIYSLLVTSIPNDTYDLGELNITPMTSYNTQYNLVRSVYGDFEIEIKKSN